MSSRRHRGSGPGPPPARGGRGGGGRPRLHPVDLSVLDWNPARGFYEGLGMVEKTEWIGYRAEGDCPDRFGARRRITPRRPYHSPAPAEPFLR